MKRVVWIFLIIASNFEILVCFKYSLDCLKRLPSITTDNDEYQDSSMSPHYSKYMFDYECSPDRDISPCMQQGYRNLIENSPCRSVPCVYNFPKREYLEYKQPNPTNQMCFQPEMYESAVGMPLASNGNRLRDKTEAMQYLQEIVRHVVIQEVRGEFDKIIGVTRALLKKISSLNEHVMSLDKDTVVQHTKMALLENEFKDVIQRLGGLQQTMVRCQESVKTSEMQQVDIAQLLEYLNQMMDNIKVLTNNTIATKEEALEPTDSPSEE